METLKSPLERAVAEHLGRLKMIAANVAGPWPGLNEQLREASAELLSAEVQALLEPFYHERVAAVTTNDGKVKTLSEVHLAFIKFARDIVHDEGFLDGVVAAAISAARQVFAATFRESRSARSSGPA